jgi:hemoglobin-like flavoprotein
MNLRLRALETSFDLVAPRGDELINQFYSRLFELAPDARPLFPADMERQKEMALAVLVLVRQSLCDLDAIVPMLRDLGARHAAYGTKSDHYALAGIALIEAMAAIAGDDWRPEYELAWGEAFGVVATVMMEGAQAAELERAA